MGRVLKLRTPVRKTQHMNEPVRGLKFEVVLIGVVGLIFLVSVFFLDFGEPRGGHRGYSARSQLWYADRSGLFLVPVSRSMGKNSSSRNLPSQIALNLLRDPPADLSSPIPSGATMRVVAIKGGQAVVNIVRPPNLRSTQDRLLTGSVVRTLLAQPGIAAVRVLPNDEFTAETPVVRNLWAGKPRAAPFVTGWFTLSPELYLLPVDVPSVGKSALELDPPTRALERAVTAAAGIRVREGATEPAIVEWGHPDFPADAGARARLVAAVVLTLTERNASRSVRFVSPGGPLDRQVGRLDLSRDLSRADAESLL